MTDDEEGEKKKMYLTVADLSTMGFAMVLLIALGWLQGYTFYRRFRHRSDFHLLFFLGGIMAGFRMMYKTYICGFSVQDKSRWKSVSEYAVQKVD